MAAPRAARAGTGVSKVWPPGSADRRGAIFVAVEASQQALARAQAAVAVRSGELAVALIAWIAAIGRVALPFVAVNLPAAAAAAQAPGEAALGTAVRKTAKQRAVGEQAVLAAAAAPSTGR